MPEGYRNDLPKSSYLTPEGDPKHEGAALERATRGDPRHPLLKPQVVPPKASELEPSITEPTKGLPFERYRLFQNGVLHQKRKPLDGWKLEEFCDQLQFRDLAIRGLTYGADYTHHDINRVEGERKKQGLEPLAGGQLLEDWEIEALQKCLYRRALLISRSSLS
ncbi:MAG: hypothetical protein LQ339_000937 [Xanthoria mediterranea]|nr:MAG: hypothetical protein LQ339_000937 [Xanthoria mediterranea]